MGTAPIIYYYTTNHPTLMALKTCIIVSVVVWVDRAQLMVLAQSLISSWVVAVRWRLGLGSSGGFVLTHMVPWMVGIVGRGQSSLSLHASSPDG